MRSPAVDRAEILASQEGMCNVCAVSVHEESGNMTFCMENKLGHGGGKQAFPPQKSREKPNGYQMGLFSNTGWASSHVWIVSNIAGEKPDRHAHLLLFMLICSVAALVVLFQLRMCQLFHQIPLFLGVYNVDINICFSSPIACTDIEAK